MKKYNTIKTPLTIEEKRERVQFYNKMVKDGYEFGPLINEEEFIKQDIFEEYVEMKCLKCGYSETVEYEFMQEIEEMHGLDYPEVYCGKCNKGTMVPLDIYNQLKKQ